MTRLSCHFPKSGHTNDTLRVVAEDWYGEFSGRVSDEKFKEAVKAVKRTCKFFPVIADLVREGEIGLDYVSLETRAREARDTVERRERLARLEIERQVLTGER